MTLQRTALFNNCLAAGGKMVPFAGWEMPVQFSGLVNEHHSVRERVGIFDISHMGVIRLDGKNPKDALQYLVPTDLYRIGAGEACYTVLLNEAGGIIDDLIIYDLGEIEEEKESLLLVINAACFESDMKWLKKNLERKDICISDAKKDGVLMALQGPDANRVLENLYQEPISDIPKFGHRAIQLNAQGKDLSDSIFIAKTGYTGEEGFELLLPKEEGLSLWQKLINSGVTPCGLGARDTLRLEASMHLYGKDIDSTTSPFEAGLGWLVHLEMPKQFIGRRALEELAEKGIKRQLIGLEIQGRAIARHGYPVMINEQKIGSITSGSWSPTLQKAIALAYVPKEVSKVGNSLQVQIRGENHLAKVVKKPFYKRKT